MDSRVDGAAPAWRFDDAGAESGAVSTMASKAVGDPLVVATGERDLLEASHLDGPSRVRRETEGGRCEVVRE